MSNLKKIIKMTAEQYEEFLANGSVEIDGITITDTTGCIVLVPEPSYYEQVDGVVMPTDAGTLATQEWVNENAKLYKHRISMIYDDGGATVGSIRAVIYSTRSTEYTWEGLLDYYGSETGIYPGLLSEFIQDGAGNPHEVRFSFHPETYEACLVVPDDSGNNPYYFVPTDERIYDIVTEI